LTKFISYYARRSNLLAVFFLVFGTSIFMIPTANAAYGNTTVICAANGGNQQSFQIGWDNSNPFFADKGYIPRLYCEGGYAGNYRTYISDTLNGGALGYYNGVVTSSNPTPSQPSPSPSPSPSESATVDTATSTSPVDTPTPSSNPETQTSTAPTGDTQSVTSDTQTAGSNTETSTQTTESTTTTASDTPSVSSVDGSTATSQPAPPEPAPAPPVPPAVEPDPPAVVPEPPLVEPEPPTPVEEAPEEAPEPPIEAEEPPPVAEEPPAEAEEPPVEPETVQADEVDLETLAPDTPVQLENGVILEAGVVVALQLLENPAELLAEIFTNPAEVLTALSNIGADMSPEVREESEKVIVSAVIAGNIATQAAASAGAVAAMRRKP
jgi:hypothetical protein